MVQNVISQEQYAKTPVLKLEMASPFTSTARKTMTSASCPTPTSTSTLTSLTGATTTWRGTGWQTPTLRRYPKDRHVGRCHWPPCPLLWWRAHHPSRIRRCQVAIHKCSNCVPCKGEWDQQCNGWSWRKLQDHSQGCAYNWTTQGFTTVELTKMIHLHILILGLSSSLWATKWVVCWDKHIGLTTSAGSISARACLWWEGRRSLKLQAFSPQIVPLQGLIVAVLALKAKLILWRIWSCQSWAVQAGWMVEELCARDRQSFCLSFMEIKFIGTNNKCLYLKLQKKALQWNVSIWI